MHTEVCVAPRAFITSKTLAVASSWLWRGSGSDVISWVGLGLG